MKRDDAKQLADQALTELQQELEVGKSDALNRYLEMLGRFHKYSFCNCLLIANQMPEATYVAGFHRWLELGRYVRKGEKGIGILAPLVYRKHEEEAEADDGDKRALRGFKVVHVFDVSQTEGEELPDLARIQGEPGTLLPALELVVRESGIELKEEVLRRGAKGVSKLGEILIAEGLPPAECFAVLAHELAHEWMHDLEQRKHLSKTVCETEAEAVAYAVCRSFGFDCSTRSSDYIQLYRGTTVTLIESLERIQKTAARIIEAVDRASVTDEEGQRHVA